ncbi:unnamed protein product [Amoebophrya sp. A25]|nr:unnamed protein product [Amoebophrya sp. A25]|eukprot:GSA25T00011697001.1
MLLYSVGAFDHVEEILKDPRAGLYDDEEPSEDLDRHGARKSPKRSRKRGRSPDEEEKKRIEQKRQADAEEREKQRKERKAKEEAEEKQRQLEEATRGERTVMVTNVNVKATEKEVYQFFKVAGGIRDIQVIRDARSGRSKGVAYVEYYQQENVAGACQLSGQMLMLQPVRVQLSQAEKNRASIVARAALLATTKDPGLKLYVSGLEGPLASITDEDLRKLFSPFAIQGQIEFIDLHKDPYTNKCKGFAYIKFEKSGEGREAIAVMNGFKHSMLGDQEISVGVAQDQGGPLMLTAGDDASAQQQGEANGAAVPSSSPAVVEEAPPKREEPEELPGLIPDAHDRLKALMKKSEKEGGSSSSAGSLIFTSSHDIMRDISDIGPSVEPTVSSNGAVDPALLPPAPPAPVGPVEMPPATPSLPSTATGSIPGATGLVNLGGAPSVSALAQQLQQLQGSTTGEFDPLALPKPAAMNNLLNQPGGVVPGGGAPAGVGALAPLGAGAGMLPGGMLNMAGAGLPGPGVMPGAGMMPGAAGLPGGPMLNIGGPGMMPGAPLGMNPMMMAKGGMAKGGMMMPPNMMGVPNMMSNMPNMMGMPPGGMMGANPMGGLLPANGQLGTAPGGGLMNNNMMSNPAGMPGGLLNPAAASAMMNNMPPGGGAAPGSIPTPAGGPRTVILSNILGANEQCSKELKEELEDDVGDECAKSGPLQSIQFRDDNKLYISFMQPEHAMACFSAMNGRLFAGKTLSAEIVD